MTAPRVGVVGLGAVGRRLAARLEATFPGIGVHDIDPEAATAIPGAIAADSPASLAAACDVVVLSLPDPDAVDAVMNGTGGVLAGARPGTVVADTSTVDPATSRAMAERAAAAGVGYLDAPVTCSITHGGGTAAAEAGELTFLVGGKSTHLERARPVLAPLAHRIHHLGPSGAGSVMKLVTNHISGIATFAVAEGLALAGAAGVDTRHCLEVCADTVADSYVLREIVGARLDGIEGPAQFSIELMHKDHRLAGRLAGELGVALPLNQRVTELCESMSADGYARRDNVSAVAWFARQPGHPRPR